MAWTNSKIFRAPLGDILKQNTSSAWTGLDSDSCKAALFNNSVTPDQDATAANTAFNAGTWLTANEVTDATNWTSGGRVLASPVVDTGTAGVVFFDAADTSGAGNVTISGAFGCLVYDDTLTVTGGNAVADMGICFNYFGGSQSVTAGAFTIIWHSNGVFRFTL